MYSSSSSFCRSCSPSSSGPSYGDKTQTHCTLCSPHPSAHQQWLQSHPLSLVHALTVISPSREKSSSSARGVGQCRIRSADKPRWRSARTTSSSLTLLSATSPPSDTPPNLATLVPSSSCCTRLITARLSVCASDSDSDSDTCSYIHLSPHTPLPSPVEQTCHPLQPLRCHPLYSQHASQWCPALDARWPHHS